MKALREEFTPKDDISPMKMEIYFKALDDLSIEDVEKATWHLIRTRTVASFPKVAEIREAVTGNIDDRATLAYDAFARGKSQTGAYDSVSFEDRIIHAVIRAMGGWKDVCLITEDEWKFRRKEFIDTYKALSRNPGSELPAKIIGLSEAGCAENAEWHKHCPPLKIISRFGDIVEVRKQLPFTEEAKQLNPAIKLVEGIGGKL